MRNIYYTLLCIVLFGTVGSVQAQITIQRSFIEDLIGTNAVFSVSELDMSSVDATALRDAAGPNQTWDVSGLSTIETYMLEQTFKDDLSDVIGIDLFEGAQFAIQIDSDTFSTLGTFHAVNAFDGDNLNALGTISRIDTSLTGAGTFVTLSSMYDPPLLEFPFPVNYEDTWTAESTLSQIIDGFPFPFSNMVREEVVVDGWGTLITASGSFEALRIRRTQFSTGLTGTELLIFDEINLLSPDGYSLSISLDEGNNVESIALSVFDSENTSTSVDDVSDLPSEFQLQQNYPNPFNPSTTIRYVLSEASPVTLRVFTLTGREVQTLVNATQSAGSHVVQFDASDLASGLYLYRLESNAFTETRMMSLIK